MMLLVLHENPYEAAIRVPKQYKHKQLLELMQMISCIVDFGYKQLPAGKKIKEWIVKNIDWTYVYAKTLFQDKDLNLKEETKIKYKCITIQTPNNFDFFILFPIEGFRKEEE